MHPDKTHIVYCKDEDRRETYPETGFDFLGYTFRPRSSKNRYGKFFVNFSPAVSNASKKEMRRKIHDWRMHLKPDKTLEDLSMMFNPVIAGWVNYFKNFYKSATYPVLRQMNNALILWAVRKHKKLHRHRKRAEQWLRSIATREPEIFIQWKMGILPGRDNGSRMS